MKNIINILLFAAFAATISYGQDPCTTILDEHIQINSNNDDAIIQGPQVQPTGPSGPPAGPTTYKPKVVSWLHGMSGDVGSWGIASTYAENTYNAVPIRQEYTQSSTMDVSISHMNEVQNQAYNDTKTSVSPDRQQFSFAIAHSLGGIVARGVSASSSTSPEWLNGLVTFNTAHKGSKLADYLHYAPGQKPEAVEELEDFVRRSVHDLANPWIAYKKYTTGLGVIDRLGFYDVDEILENNPDNTLFNKSVEKMVDFVLKDIGSPAAADLTPEYMASATFQDKLPTDRKMMVYTNIIPEHIETEEPHTSAFKMFYSGMNGVNNAGTFGAGIHTTLATEKLNENMQKYKDNETLFNAIWHLQPWYGSWVPIGPLTKQLIYEATGVQLGWDPLMNYNDMRRTRDKFKRGHQTFHKINNYWENMCGVSEYSTANTGTCNCFDEGSLDEYGEPTEEIFQNVSWQDCSEMNTGNSSLICSYSPTAVVTKHGYDGFITDDSQSGWEGVLDNHKLYFEGSNHVQIRNDGNTQIAIDNIFRKDFRFFGK